MEKKIINVTEVKTIYKTILSDGKRCQKTFKTYHINEDNKYCLIDCGSTGEANENTRYIVLYSDFQKLQELKNIMYNNDNIVDSYIEPYASCYWDGQLVETIEKHEFKNTKYQIIITGTIINHHFKDYRHRNHKEGKED